MDGKTKTINGGGNGRRENMSSTLSTIYIKNNSICEGYDFTAALFHHM